MEGGNAEEAKEGGRASSLSRNAGATGGAGTRPADWRCMGLAGALASGYRCDPWLQRSSCSSHRPLSLPFLLRRQMEGWLAALARSSAAEKRRLHSWLRRRGRPATGDKEASG